MFFLFSAGNSLRTVQYMALDTILECKSCDACKSMHGRVLVLIVPSFHVRNSSDWSSSDDRPGRSIEWTDLAWLLNIEATKH